MRSERRMLQAVIVGGLVGLGGACSAPVGPTTPDLAGSILEVSASSDGGVRLLVADRAGRSEGSRFVLHVNRTMIVRARGDGRLVVGDRRALVVGAHIRAVSTGIVLESDPPQWFAKMVEVLEFEGEVAAAKAP